MQIISILKMLSGFLIILFGVFTYIRNQKSSLNRAFLSLTLSIACWILFFSVAQNLNDNQALIMFKIGYIGIILIPFTFFRFVFEFTNSQKILHPIFPKVVVIIPIFFIYFLLFSNEFIVGFNSFPWGIYPKAQIPGHIIFLFYFFSFFMGSFLILTISYIKYFKRNDLIQLSKVKYVYLGSIMATFASIDFIPNYGIDVFPFGFIFMLLFPLFFAYAIVKYRLMDVKLAFTRTGIFVAVYSLVLGIPFAIAFLGKSKLRLYFGDNWWLVPMVALTVLATVGPFIYLYIQKRAEEQLLKEQRRYQSTLSQASAGMGRIKDLKRLLELIVYIVTRAVRLDHSSVYIFDQNKSKYLLGAYKRNVAMKAAVEVGSDSPLVQYLIKTKAPVVYEEIKQRVQDYNDAHLAKIEDSLKQLDAALVIPSLIEDRLLALLVLGKKKSGKLYGEDDLSVFSILANQAALAIENAQFYEDVKKTQEQLFQAEKMATIGTMADGLSHQINNRLHALGFIAGDALDTIKLKRGAAMSDEIKGIMNDLERSLVRIQENVLQGGEIVQGLLRYTRKGDIGFAPVEIDKLVTAALEMAQFKIKTHEMKILREYDKNGPKIKGNFTQLQEVFFNMIDNAYDAMMQRKNEQKEAGFQPTLRIQALVQGDRIIIKFLDNGIGVKPEDFQKIFTPFFTTKLSSKKGTGLGLYVIKKIIDDNHKGKVTFESQYMQGTTMILNLPIAH